MRTGGKRRLLTAALVVALSGCTETWPFPATPPRVEPRADVLSTKAMSHEFLLLGDNQTHYLYPDPFLYRSAFIDHHVVPVAIRSPEQDLFGQDLLRYAVRHWAADAPVIHMGDALDISCTVEWAEFATLMQEATALPTGLRRHWVMVPGNHDGYFFGNFSAASDEAQWKQACRPHANAAWSELQHNAPMHKSQYLDAYLAVLGSVLPSLAAARAGHAHGQWSCDAATCAAHELQAAAWNIDDAHPWRSYLVQRVDLGMGSQAILVDTSSYSSAPTVIGTHAGQTGSIRREERDIVSAWVTAAAPHPVVIFGHHQYYALDGATKSALDGLMAKDHVVLYVSAHTHEGQFYAHGEGKDGWLELNIGSVLDWHPEARDFALKEEKKPQAGRKIFESNLMRFTPSLDDSDWQDCKEPWRASSADADYYIDYMRLTAAGPETTELRIADSLLAAYERLFKLFPAAGVDAAKLAPANFATLAAKHARLFELDDLERARLAVEPEDSLHRQYRLCQAVWASSHEVRRTNTPEVFDTTIQLKLR